MLQTIAAVNQAVNNFIWGVPAMVCIIGVGLLLSVRTGFIQIRKFPYAIRTTIGRMFRKRDASDGAMTPFQAVCTALAATVGTGNIAGVAGAIAIGGGGGGVWGVCFFYKSQAQRTGRNFYWLLFFEKKQKTTARPQNETDRVKYLAGRHEV